MLFKKTILLMMLTITTYGYTFTPESGFWVSDNGYGVSIEIQDNYLFAAIYVYDVNGNPIWYSAQASLQGNSLLNTGLNLTVDGTCIDCPPSQPTTFINEGGPVTIDFLTETTGTIQFGGQIHSLQRFNFILGDELTKMLGEWQLIMDVSRYTDGYPYIADVMVFEQTEIIDGDPMVTGCRSESTFFNRCTQYAIDNNDLAAIYDQGELIAVVRDDASNFIAYYLKVGTYQFDGEAYSYPVGSSPNLNNDGFLVRGWRSASRTFVESGSGPSKTQVNNPERRSGLNELLLKHKKEKISYQASERANSENERIHSIIKKLEKRLIEQ